jgi:hypothetical protein
MTYPGVEVGAVVKKPDETDATVELCEAGTVTTDVSERMMVLVTRVVVVASIEVELAGSEVVLEVRTASVSVIVGGGL